MYTETDVIHTDALVKKKRNYPAREIQNRQRLEEKNKLDESRKQSSHKR